MNVTSESGIRFYSNGYIPSQSSLPHWSTQSRRCLLTTLSFILKTTAGLRIAIRRFIRVIRNTENNYILSVDAAKLSIHSE